MRIHNNDGFSLIEISIALIIIGLLITPLVTLYNAEITSRRLLNNNANMTMVKDNINFFVAQNGRYPVPASLLAAPGDVDYGQSQAGALDLCSSWPTATGICLNSTTVNSTFFGAVPFKDLGIDEKFSLDSWGNKILYAVTKDQAVIYTPGNGLITTQFFDGPPTNALINDKTDNDLILLSHGETAAGAYDRYGNLNVACPTGAGAALDRENCNFDNIFILRENITIDPPVGSASNVPGPSFYDDVTEHQRSFPIGSWQQSLMDPTYAITYAERVGIGIEDPDYKLHVIGRIDADRVLSDSVCRLGAIGCFDPEIIIGDVAAMDCSNSLAGDQAVVRIKFSSVFCGAPVDSVGNPVTGEAFTFPSSIARTNCKLTGGLVKGILPSGAIDCEVP